MAKHKNTKIINFWAGPGSGKSTSAAHLFAVLKQNDYDCELVTEFAKQLVWQERHATFNDQLYILSKQNHKLETLRGKVDYIISDSPICLSLIYQPKDYYASFKSLVWDIWNSYDNVNIFLNRTKKYNPNGRNQKKKK